MKYVTRLKDGKPFQFQECPRCGLAVGDDCECKPDNDDGKWLIPWLIFSAIIGLGAVFYASTAEAQWYDERKLEYTPASTLRHQIGQIDVSPANLFERGDVVRCVMIDLDGNIVDTVDVELGWRRLVTFHSQRAYEYGALAYCKQGG